MSVLVAAGLCMACSGSDDGSSPGGGGASSGGTSSGGTSSGGTSSGGSAGASGAGGSAGSGGASGSGGAAGSGGGACVDTCAAPGGGITWDCKKRFFYGPNYAWEVFAGDFGGISAWGQKGVSAQPAVHAANLADIRSHGGSVIRWWMFPDFRGDGVQFDGNESPTGLGGTAVADIEKALELAAQAGVYLQLTLFSFDNFSPSGTNSGIYIPGMAPMIQSASKRKALIDNVVRKVAQTVAASPYADRVVSWDVINEPEWAMTGTDSYGDPAFESNSGLQPVSFSEMETFVKEATTALHAESSALVTVGGAAVKWSKAWTKSGLDFYTFHIYDWVDTYWPYSTPASQYGLDKPIVMGEMPFTGLNGTPYGTIVDSLYANGYAGAMPWQYAEVNASGLTSMKGFADKHSCETSYEQTPQILYPAAAPAASKPVIPSLRRCVVVDGIPSC